MLRAPWGTAASEEEARANLQARLTVLFKLMFWSFVALLGFLKFIYLIYGKRDEGGFEPDNDDYVYLLAAGGLAVMAFLWRVVLVRRRLSVAALHGIDLFYAFGTGAILSIAAILAKDFRPSAYSNLTYLCCAVLTRALIVPSTGARTALTSTLAFVPMAVAAFWLGFGADEEIPPIPFVVGFFIFAGVAVLLAASGSRIIYDLGRQIRAAQRLGQYTLDRKIGEGGMGIVYLAHHSYLRRESAIKLLLPDRIGAENLERFEREVKAMSQLTHPNTVAVFDYGRNLDGQLYYAMEYLGGGIDLEQLVKKYGPQPPGRVADVLAQVCGALNEAHARGFAHRDIKPANIILCERGLVPDVAKVVDFGLVKEFTADTGLTTQTILGTPGYVAPEAFTDPARVGPAVDLYALGAVAYFLVTGQRVFLGKTAVDTCIQHITQSPRLPSQIDGALVTPELEAVILKCLSKRPEDRYASASALAEALRALPRDPSWDRARARQWWRSRATAGHDVQADIPTETITIDLGHRGAPA
jgi:serine/threonine-protein kinase